MPRLHQKSGYIKSGGAGGYAKYIAKRDGVQILHTDAPSTKAQDKLIDKILRDFPDAIDKFEYADYLTAPTMASASAFISAALDENMQSLMPESGYMKYIAQRPSVEKLGDHGLFGVSNGVDLSAAVSELESHEGNVWTIIYSLRREDAARLGYDSAESWRSLLMHHQHDLAKAMKIPPNDFRWYAAFHDASHHPHIHMMVWSEDPKRGYLTRDGISEMRSKLTGSIFKDELEQVYADKSIAYKDLTSASREAMRQLIEKMQNRICDNPVIEQYVRQLADALETVSGKKQYGYLPKPVKEIVDSIVDELAKEPEVRECYEKWNEIRDKLNGYYNESEPREHRPFSQQKEFRAIKNMVIREANSVRVGILTFEDEKIQDEPEPEYGSYGSDDSRSGEKTGSSVYEQAAKYRSAKQVLFDEISSRSEKETAVKTLEQLWNEGYTIAAHALGRFYRDDDLFYDTTKAELRFRHSAEAGNDFSEYALGKLLIEQKRNTEALRWLEKAAAQGNQFAQYRIGKIYLLGDAVPKDVKKALEYLTNSAKQGNQYAQYAIGKLYLLGKDLPQDKEQAKEWLSRSAAQGNEYARFFLDRFDEYRDPSVMLSATKLLYHMSRVFRNNSPPPANPAGIRIDSKRRRELQRRRLALGHRLDDHEDEVNYQMTQSM